MSSKTAKEAAPAQPQRILVVDGEISNAVLAQEVNCTLEKRINPIAEHGSGFGYLHNTLFFVLVSQKTGVLVHSSHGVPLSERFLLFFAWAIIP